MWRHLYIIDQKIAFRILRNVLFDARCDEPQSSKIGLKLAKTTNSDGEVLNHRTG